MLSVFSQILLQQKLEVLDLRDNDISNVKRLKKFMKATWSIKKFDLRGNIINNDGLIELWDGLKNNLSITELLYNNKSSCTFTKENIMNIEKQLNLNKAIHAIIDQSSKLDNLKTMGQSVTTVTGEYAQYNVEVEESQRRFDPRIRTTLNLSGENIPDIEALCKYISLSQCKELILCNCDLTLKQLKTLIFFMQEYNVKLDKLDLSNNKDLKSQAWYSLSKVWSNGVRSGINTIILDGCTFDTNDLLDIL